jgi:glyoxylase-like metal-dependent hydrolase (beta-lactamase superfamily II)
MIAAIYGILREEGWCYMNYKIARLTPDAYAIAIEDSETWDMWTYTNMYVLRREDRIILIDAGMHKYQAAMIKALAEIGMTPEMITDVLLTHGHRDHADGASIFPHSKNYVHALDLGLITPSLSSRFLTYASQKDGFELKADGIEDLDVVLVNSHTPGSVAIFDHVSKAIFVGDFFCYFGEPLLHGEIVTYGEHIRQGSCQYVADQAESGEAGFESFMQGLERLLPYHPEFFCTGHGVILQSKIHDFMHGLYDAGVK